MADPVATATETVHLKRSLGRWDLVALFVVAVFNLNVVPSIAANGGVTVWLWLISLVLFFWPQGIAVIELAHRYPGEGGVYLWAKEVFGDFHGFLSGWCYWTNNMMYVPTVMLYFVGVSVFVLGPGHQALADNRAFTVIASLLLMALLVILNIVGLGVGKWINNIGGIGTGVAAAVLIGLGLIMYFRFGTTVTAGGFSHSGESAISAEFLWRDLFWTGWAGAGFGDGRRNQGPAENFARRGGLGRSAFRRDVHRDDADAADRRQQERHQRAAGNRAGGEPHGARVDAIWIVAPFALMLSISIAGIGSAWLAGSARIPFVAGLDSYMPSWLGKTHPRYATPYAALIVQGVVSTILVLINSAGSGVQETFQRLLSLAVVLQLIPFLYMFGALLKIAANPDSGKGLYSKTTLFLAGGSGLVTTMLGIVLAFFPAQQISSLLSYETWMFGGTAFFIGLAVFFFYVYGRRKVARAAASGI